MVPPLADPLAFEAEPRSALLHHLLLNAQIEQIRLARDALAVENVHLGVAERRGHLVLHDLDLGAIPDHLLAVLDSGRTPNLAANGRVELQRAPSGGGFGIAEYHADLLADLIDAAYQRV